MRSNHSSFTTLLRVLREKHILGGAGRDRTDDILLAKQALSQLSYSPLSLCRISWHAILRGGGSGWIRTIDPRLIKTVL